MESQNIFDRLEDFPEPEKDGENIFLDEKNGYSLIKYTSRSGIWVKTFRIYPARTG